MSLSVQLAHKQGKFALDVAFEAPAGVTAIFGHSGAGKTTLVNAVAGLIRPDAGRVALFDEVLFDHASGIFCPPHSRQMGYVFQDARLFPHLSVAQNLDFGARFAKARAASAGAVSGPTPGRDDVIALLELAPLLSRAPRELSGGEKQRVALGRALLARPKVLLMDEPLAALDGRHKDSILPYLERLKISTIGLPILYVSHALDEIARLADQIVILSQGRVAMAGDLFDVLSDPTAVPLVGVRQAGAVIMAEVVAHDDDGISTLRVSGGQLALPGVQAPVGARVRLRILAQDVILARACPTGLSTRNILPVTVQSIHTGDGPGAAVSLLCGADRILARIPANSLKGLEITEGAPCFAVINAVSVAPASIGR